MPATRAGRNSSRPATADPNHYRMIIYIAAVAGACTFVVLWSIGLNADVGGLVALGMLFLGVLVHMARGMISSRREETG